MTAAYATSTRSASQPARSRMLWALLGTLAGAQLLAFWLLCNHQVRKAEARHTEVMVQQLAVADCLQYVPGSTIASCSSRVGALGAAPHDTGAGAAAIPVSFYR